MKGYRIPPPEPEYVEAMIYVGCRKCWSTWSEKGMQNKYGPCINGPLYMYDACDNCYDAEARTYREKPRSSSCLEKHLDVSSLRMAGM